MALRFLFLLLFCFALRPYGQGQNFKAQYFETQPGAVQAQYLDYSLGDTLFLKRETRYQFFPTASGSSGELREDYWRLQFAHPAQLENCPSLVLPLDEGGRWRDFDFRYWYEGLIVWEGHSANLTRFWGDSIYDPHTGALRGVSLQLPELRPGLIVELYVQSEGAAFPWLYLPEASSLPRELHFEINIISAHPLRWQASPHWQMKQERQYDFESYHFEWHAAHADTNTRPFLRFDWQDQVRAYDRESTADWPGLLHHLHYRGKLRDYSVFNNHLAQRLGRRHYRGPRVPDPYYFHWHRDDLAHNAQRAAGFARLGLREADLWLAFEQQLDFYSAQKKWPLDSALWRLLRDSDKLSQALAALPQKPAAFTDYPLLLAYFRRFLHARGYRVSLLLMRPPQYPLVDSTWLSLQAWQALGLAYRHPESGHEDFFILPPYAGRVWPPGVVPADLAGGQALHYDLSTGHRHWRRLPEVSPQQSAFARKRQLQVSFRYAYWRPLEDFWEFKGLFESPVYHQYLVSDSAYDVRSFTPYALDHQQALRRQQLRRDYPAEQHFFTDTLQLALPFDEALVYQRREEMRPSAASAFPYRASKIWRIACDGHFEYQLLSGPKGGGEDFHWQVEARRISPRELEIRLNFAHFPCGGPFAFEALEQSLRDTLILELWKANP